MIIKSNFFATCTFIYFCTLAFPAHAGQLFPPNNLSQNPNIACPNGGVLTWNSDHVDCVNPTPGVTVACAAGEVLTGINGGRAACIAIPICSAGQSLAFNGSNFSCAATQGGFNPQSCHIVTARGGAPYYISDARCEAGEFMLNGGGRAEVPGSDLCAGTTRGFIHTSIPDADMMGWTVDAFNNTWTGEACTEAYAVCCSVP